MKFPFLLGSVLLLSAPGNLQDPGMESIVWRLDSLKEIGGMHPSVLGNPTLIENESGTAVQFDGLDDALVLGQNPLSGFAAFTLEVIFRPDAGGSPEQRFVHVQELDDHRILIETRLTPDGRWFLDTFLKSGDSELTLYAKDFLHPTGDWFHAALTYQDGLMRHFVNGVPEMEGSVQFHAMNGGRASIGCRLNRVFWFKGAVRAVSFSSRALPPDEFVLRP